MNVEKSPDVNESGSFETAPEENKEDASEEKQYYDSLSEEDNPNWNCYGPKDKAKLKAFLKQDKEISGAVLYFLIAK
jgi:predicted RNA-binding protein with PUA-like domain